MGFIERFKKSKTGPVIKQVEQDIEQVAEKEQEPEHTAGPVTFNNMHGFQKVLDFSEIGIINTLKYEYYDIDIAGVEHRIFDWSVLEQGVPNPIRVDLVCEPENEFDSKAVKVMYKGMHIGYIPKTKIQDMVNDYLNREDRLIVPWLVSADESQSSLILSLGFYHTKKTKCTEEYDDDYDDELIEDEMID